MHKKRTEKLLKVSIDDDDGTLTQAAPLCSALVAAARGLKTRNRTDSESAVAVAEAAVKKPRRYPEV